MERSKQVLKVIFLHRRDLMAQTTLGLMAACVLLVSQEARATQLVSNGGFEIPAQQSNYLLVTSPGSGPTGFDWTVGLQSVEIHGQGYVGGSGTFAGPAYEGHQWLDLDGYPSPGSISQTITTSPGGIYSLSFAYANNPFRIGPALATVYVQNSMDSANLITPLLISHGTATGSNYDWTLAGPFSFIAQGSSTTLRFVSNNGVGDGGIFLDAISIVPEPSTFVLAGLGLVGLAVRRRRARPANGLRKPASRSSVWATKVR